ncbi:MAG: class E sortase [Acidimicrobiia bacterium]
MWLSRTMAVLGRVLTGAGVLALLYVAYTLWGTGIRTRQAQERLERQFQERLADTAPSTTVPTTTTGANARPAPSTTAASIEEQPRPEPPAPGEPAARLEIPGIGLDVYVVQGVSDADLRKGPGHYPGTPLPGEAGNAAIAGHRTTYGAPFGRVDELEPDDEIIVTTDRGRHRYVVADPPYEIVAPDRVDVLGDKGDNRLTLTACHPKYSAAERIVVSARLHDDPVVSARAVPALPSPGADRGVIPTRSLDAGVAGEASSEGALRPALLYGILGAAVGVAAWALGRAWRKVPAYALAAPVFLVVLFYFFENVERL